MTRDWATGVLLAALVQNLAVAAAVLTLRSGRPADLRLAALLCVLAFKTVPYLFDWRGHAEAPDWLALLPLNAPLAIGPLLLGYLVARTTGRAPRREWLQLMPAAAEFTYCCVCLLLPVDLRHDWKETGHDHWVKPALELAFVISLSCYTILSWRVLCRLGARAQAERSDADRVAAVLSPVTFALLLGTALGYGFIFVYGNFIAEIDIGPYYLWFAIVSMIVALEGWRATAIPSLATPAITVLSRERKAHDWPALGERWRDRVEAAGWWREPDLALAEVSRRLGVNATYLSRAVNEGLGLNFNELVNGMRAREVARHLVAAEGGDLLALAFDAGFTSKATFNRAFRATFGVTPSAYRRGIRS